MVKTTVAQQIQWLNDCEKSLEIVMNQVIAERHSREYAQVDRLLDMIHANVRAGEPLREIWEMTPDSIVVHRHRLVIKAEDAYPEAKVQAFNDVTLNDEQLRGMREWADLVKVAVIFISSSSTGRAVLSFLSETSRTRQMRLQKEEAKEEGKARAGLGNRRKGKMKASIVVQGYH